MQLLLAGIGLEILAFISLLFYDLFGVPFIISILIHIGASYLFTRGIEPLLQKVRLTREVCFLFSLFLPVYGMLGIVFQIFVVRKIKPIKSIIREKAKTDTDEESEAEDFLFESENISDLMSVHVKKIRYDYVPENNRVFTYNYYSGTRYGELRNEFQEKIRKMENEHAGDPENRDKLTKYALSLVEYAAAIETETAAKRRCLVRAEDCFKELLKENADDINILSGLMETRFLLHEFKDCIKICRKIIEKDHVNEQAVMRLAECYYYKRNYKSIIDLAKNTKALVKKPEDLQFFTEMWTVNG
jgi:hypothetical protein